MAQILLLETSASSLSVALARDREVLCERVCTRPRQQASLTAPLVKEVLDAAGVSLKDCDAVAVSSGPGSYTGLRVGVSTAKGLCFGAGLPLLSVGTLDILVAGARCPVGAGHDGGGHDVIAGPDRQSVTDRQSGTDRPSFIVPMLDARRMEVYTAVYNADGERLTPIEAKVVEEGSFAGFLAEGKVLFVGDGALKCKPVIGSENALFLEAQPLARHMCEGAFDAFEAGRFENLAYFEPFYLKDFVATVSKKQLW